MTFADGYEAWSTDKALEDYEAAGVVNEEFLDGWFAAKETDPELAEEMMILGDEHEPTGEA